MREEMKWVCVDCNKVLDKTNFVDFIKESDNDKYSNQEAVVQYHHWTFLLHHPHRRGHHQRRNTKW